MTIEIGVIGPHDLVDDVAATCEEQPGVTARRLHYDHESQAPAIVEAHAGQHANPVATGASLLEFEVVLDVAGSGAKA